MWSAKCDAGVCCHLQVRVDTLTGVRAAQGAAAHLEGRLRFVAQRAQRARHGQAAFPYAQVARLQRAAHAPIVQYAVAHLPPHPVTQIIKNERHRLGKGQRMGAINS